LNLKRFGKTVKRLRGEATEENNAENLLVIRDRKLAEGYIKNWQEYERHSEVYIGTGM
jgi:hypothetical protein